MGEKAKGWLKEIESRCKKDKEEWVKARKRWDLRSFSVPDSLV